MPKRTRTRTAKIIPVQVLMVLTTAEDNEGEAYCKRKFVDAFPIDDRDNAVEAGKELGLEELELKGDAVINSASVFAYYGPPGQKKFIVIQGLLALESGRKTTGGLLMGPVTLKRRKKQKASRST
jgi:hypothetical protein